MACRKAIAADLALSPYTLKGNAMSEENNSKHLETEETLARLGGDRELLGELYAAFAEDVPGKCNDLVAAVQAKDASAIMRRAHSLKGSAAAVGATGCRDLAVQLESKAEANDEGAVQQLIQQLKTEVDQVLVLIHQQL